MVMIGIKKLTTITELYALGVRLTPEASLKKLWIHSRRENRKSQSGLAFIQKLYTIERRIKDEPPDSRYAICQAEAKPIFDDLKGGWRKAY